MATDVRAEHVGSLLRPAELIQARSRYEEGRLRHEQLHEVEDKAVLDALELQRSVGMPVVTDGEMRRRSWLAMWWESVEGLTSVDVNPLQIEWHDVPETITESELELEAVAVATTMRRKSPSPAEREAAFLLQHAGAPFKVTMASANMSTSLWVPGLSTGSYASPQELLRDAVAVQIEEIEALLDLGVTWIQIDSLRYNAIIDENTRRQVEQAGVDVESMLAENVAVDNELIAAARRKNPDVTVALHHCRGNNRSAWASSGGLDTVAEQLLGGVDVDRFLLEYDTERSGSFEPLRFVPKGKTVVLGLVSTKTPQLESEDDLVRRIEEASKVVPIDDLALSPQCGFASTAGGNLLTVDDERRKLELVVRTAQRVWGQSS
jgi:5-methyltetrahydropteroyltriglutamate--homocysteine methyltransferase